MDIDLNSKIIDRRNQLLNHPLYEALETLDDVRCFMAHHVFAVWDYMSLLKTLQNRLTNTSVPWFPKGEPGMRKMINEIVLEEESDALVGGLSHFEWYLAAMKQVNANTASIDELIMTLEQGQDYQTYIDSLPYSIKQFVKTSLNLCLHGEEHTVAAAFAIGRENLIPIVFTEIIHGLHHRYPNELSSFVRYLRTHIETERDQHGQLAKQMLLSMCKNSQQRFKECEEVALLALESRLCLWDGILEEINLRHGYSTPSLAVS